MRLEIFDDVIASMRKNPGRPYHLLLGNGFSMAYDPKIFSYNALYNFIGTLQDELLSKVFSVVQTKNLEQIMEQLTTFSALAAAFGADSALVAKSDLAVQRLKQSLIDAIKALHPEHVFKIEEARCKSCADFLQTFLSTNGRIFTSNYDILLYWVLMRSAIEGAGDGFGRDRLSPDEVIDPNDVEWSELRWGRNKDTQSIFYLHGALPLFDTGIDIVKEEYTGSEYLLQVINDRISRGEYPVFVTAGNGTDKLKQIMHNRYLAYCYEVFSNITGSLVTYGFGFGEYDFHMVDAINAAAKKKSYPKLLSVYIGIYSQEGRSHIESLAESIKCKVHIFDAKPLKPWG